MDRRTFLATTGAVAVTGCIGGEAKGDADVTMTTRRFKPAQITVGVGETVVWKNTSSHAHTVTADEEEIPSGADYWATGDFDGEEAARDGWKQATKGGLSQGETYEREFTVPGEHNYLCIPHVQSGMTGVVVVEEETES